VTTSIPVQLPKERVEVRESKPENIVISVDKAGNVYWFDARVSDTENLVARLKKVSTMKPQPEVHIRGDMDARYNGVGRILYACQRAGITKVSFITEPPPLGV
jgi:biopolymer transport protein ExbD